MLVRVDPHSPGNWRVNGVVRNMPEFQKAFGCKAGPAHGASERVQGMVNISTE